MDIEIGKIIEGKVIRITSFGAFIELDKGITGLIHISEIANAYVSDINQFIQVGDIVQVKLITKDDAGKIGLSLKQAVAKETVAPQPRAAVWEAEKIISEGFEDKLARFIKDSNEKQQALKKHQETKKCR
jgi:S1 RNA binding domain protein